MYWVNSVKTARSNSYKLTILRLLSSNRAARLNLLERGSLLCTISSKFGSYFFPILSCSAGSVSSSKAMNSFPPCFRTLKLSFLPRRLISFGKVYLLLIPRMNPDCLHSFNKHFKADSSTSGSSSKSSWKSDRNSRRYLAAARTY